MKMSIVKTKYFDSIFCNRKKQDHVYILYGGNEKLWDIDGFCGKWIWKTFLIGYNYLFFSNTVFIYIRV